MHLLSMGNVSSSSLKRSSSKIDGGRCYKSYTDEEWTPSALLVDIDKVAQLVKERRLAPFFTGSDTPTSMRFQYVESGFETKDFKEYNDNGNVRHEYAKGFKKKGCYYELGLDLCDPLVLSRRPLFLRKVKWDQSYVGRRMNSMMSDCPICCFFYPINVNYTSCCKKPICTDCFVRLRRHYRLHSIKCPYCNSSELSVFYQPPSKWCVYGDLRMSSKKVFPQDTNSNPPQSFTHYGDYNRMRQLFY